MLDALDVMGGNILIVDDLEANVLLLERMLRGAGYTSVNSTTAPGSVAELHRANHYDLIILDLNMPGMDGFQVMDALKVVELDGYLPVLVITAEPRHRLHALQAGARDFITKPFELPEVLLRTHNMLETRLLHAQAKSHGEDLQRLNSDLGKRVQEQVREISDAQHATIVAMSALAEARDDATGKHLERTMAYCRLLALHLRDRLPSATAVADDFVENVVRASPLHDIGKVAIPDSILLKPAQLTPAEFDIMKTHCVRGAAVLQSVHDRYPQNAFITIGVQIARSHHEKWDGSGYPDGLAGSAIPLSAQIMALADVYDALRATRCYKEAFSHSRSAEIIADGRGTHFGPDVADAFVALQQEFDGTHSAAADG